MADLSTGNDDKSVTKSNSFNMLLGKSPGRALSSKKSSKGPFSFSKLFSRSKKIDKKVVEEYADDSSPRDSTEAAIDNVTEETTPATLLQKLQEDAPKVIQEVISHTNTENLAKELTNAIPVADESKESTPATEKRKPEFFSKLMGGAEKAKEEMQAKAKDELHKIGDGITEAYKSFTSTYKKEPIEQQPIIVDDNKKIQEKEVIIVDEPNVPPVPLSTQGEAEVVARVAEPTKTDPEATNQGENPEMNKDKKQEENCVTYLAEGLQKICAPTWNNNNKKEN